MAALTVSPQVQGQGDGERILKRVEQRARALGLESIFVLTTRTMHWFIKRGFVQVDPDWLPEARKRKYNWDRRSQVFVKKLADRYRRLKEHCRRSTMARMVQCVYLKREAEGLDFAPYPGELGKRIYDNGQQGSLGGLDEAPDDAGQRKPPESRRPARPAVSGAPDGEFLLRRRRRAARAVMCRRPPETLLNSPPGFRLTETRTKDSPWRHSQELMAQREALEQQIEQTKKQERGDAVEKVRALMAEYGLTVADLGNGERAQGEESQVERQQGRRRNIAMPRPENPGAAAAAAALAEGGAGERRASCPTSRSDGPRRRPCAWRAWRRCDGSRSRGPECVAYDLPVIPPPSSRAARPASTSSRSSAARSS